MLLLIILFSSRQHSPYLWFVYTCFFLFMFLCIVENYDQPTWLALCNAYIGMLNLNAIDFKLKIKCKFIFRSNSRFFHFQSISWCVAVAAIYQISLVPYFHFQSTAISPKTMKGWLNKLENYYQMNQFNWIPTKHCETNFKNFLFISALICGNFSNLNENIFDFKYSSSIRQMNFERK